MLNFVGNAVTGEMLVLVSTEFREDLVCMFLRSRKEQMMPLKALGMNVKCSPQASREETSGADVGMKACFLDDIILRVFKEKDSE